MVADAHAVDDEKVSLGSRIWRDGAQVVVYGEVSVYEARGQYQLIVRVVIGIDPAVSTSDESDETGIVVAAIARSTARRRRGGNSIGHLRSIIRSLPTVHGR